MPSRRTSVAAFLLAGALLAATAAGAEEAPAARALLIGVQDYPGLPQRLHLRAPAGDAERLRAALLGAGMPAGSVQLMTEREGPRPTRAAILSALGDLAAQARPGERVLIYFSGHGAQAPARRPSREPDGLEELYLAADASEWDGGTRSVPGALADFELESAVDAIRARGAEVWFIADACHAAGLTRDGAGAGVRTKSVSPADLHVPGARTLLRARSDETTALRPTARGGFTGFYAASPGSLAVERPLPGGDGGSASVFTYSLVRAIGQGRFRTLRDLALAVSSATDAGAGAPAPVFEGALGASMLGLSPAVRTFRVRRAGEALSVDAGVFEGFDPGAGVELVSWPDGRPAGAARVLASGPATARLQVNGTIPDGPLAARLAQPSATTLRAGDRVLASLHTPAPDGAAAALRVESRLWRSGCAANPATAGGFPEGSEPFDLLAPRPLRHCDVLYLSVANAGAAAVDVSPLYLDAAGGIADLSFAPRDDVRLNPGETRYAALRVVTRDRDGRTLPHGTERLVLIASPAGPRRLDLRSLAQPAPLRSAPASPGEGVEALVFTVRTED